MADYYQLNREDNGWRDNNQKHVMLSKVKVIYENKFEFSHMVTGIYLHCRIRHQSEICCTIIGNTFCTLYSSLCQSRFHDRHFVMHLNVGG
jgi:hypothetical protein